MRSTSGLKSPPVWASEAGWAAIRLGTALPEIATLTMREYAVAPKPSAAASWNEQESLEGMKDMPTVAGLGPMPDTDGVNEQVLLITLMEAI